MWDPLRGTRRLLYDCVWLVSANQFSANPASPVPPRAAEVSLHLRKLLANCTWAFSSALCELSPSWLQITKAQGLGRRTDHWVYLPRGVPSYFGKPNYLVQLSVIAELGLRIVIWLILPVVIRLSQRLSHACLSINAIQWNCEWLIKTVIVYLVIKITWITVVILELIHAVKPDFLRRLYLLDSRPIFLVSIVVTHSNWSDRTGVPATNHSSFCPISFRW